MSVRQVQINACVLELRMAEKHLNGAQVRAGFEQVGCIRVSQNMRSHSLLDARSFGGLLTGFPRHLCRDWHVSTKVIDCAGEEPRFLASSSASTHEVFRPACR